MRTALRHQESLALVREMTSENSPPSTVPSSPVSANYATLPEGLAPPSARTPVMAHPLSPTTSEFASARRPSVTASTMMTGETNPLLQVSRQTSQMQPFRDECARIVATFFTPGAAKELSLDANVRDTVVRNLTWNTHPDVVSNFHVAPSFAHMLTHMRFHSFSLRTKRRTTRSRPSRCRASCSTRPPSRTARSRSSGTSSG